MKNLRIVAVTNPLDLDAVFDDSRNSTPVVQHNKRTAAQQPPRATASSAAEPIVPRELSVQQRIDEGYVNPGWRPSQWAARLLQLADRCERLHPDLAADFRRWAANVLLQPRSDGNCHGSFRGPRRACGSAEARDSAEFGLPFFWPSRLPGFHLREDSR